MWNSVLRRGYLINPVYFKYLRYLELVFSTVLEIDGDIQIGGRSGGEFNFLWAELNAIFETIDFDKYQSFRFASPVYLRYKIFLVLQTMKVTIFF